MSRKIVLFLGLVASSGWPAPPPACGQQEKVTEEQIQTAIQKAVAHLRQSPSMHQGGGEGALVTMALLKSGVPADSREIKFGVTKIVEQVTNGQYKVGQHHVYEAGVSIMALANADAKLYKPQIEAITEYLIYAQRPTGEWDYPTPGNGDTSITQYAILGLWEAVRAGVNVPKRVWDKAAGWHVPPVARRIIYLSPASRLTRWRVARTAGLPYDDRRRLSQPARLPVAPLSRCSRSR